MNALSRFTDTQLAAELKRRAKERRVAGGEGHRIRLLRLLADGTWHTNTELAGIAGYRYGDVVFKLRCDGVEIESKMVGHNQAHWEYRLTTKQAAP